MPDGAPEIRTPVQRPNPAVDGGRSRITAIVRLALAVWLLVTAVSVLIRPEAISEIATARSAAPDTLLRIAGLHFTLGIFLLSGFMSRVAGLVLAAAAVWQMLNVGGGAVEGVLVLVGVYLVLRGGGTWGMDVYVQKMQERVRRKEALKAAAQRDTPSAGR